MSNQISNSFSNKLNTYFPMIRSREEVLCDIGSDSQLAMIFHSWSEAQQTEFLDFCTGVRGVKILYDAFFKEIMNPEYTPERLSDFLSLVLHQQVQILEVLPNDSSRIGSESSLLITDVVVELEDHSIANVEVQKFGYFFPGQRSACYSADLLLRQYKRVRERKKQENRTFSYRDVKNVYTVVLFETSPQEFHAPEFKDTYLHSFYPTSDTGIVLELLQNYCFIPLDIFKNCPQTKGITNRLDAWLTFLSTDDPDSIVALITQYPDFKDLYTDIYELCRNTEDVMGLFSKELQMLDENTVQYMIDDMQDKIDEQAVTIDEQASTIDEQASTIGEQAVTIDEQTSTIGEQAVTIDEQASTINELLQKLQKLEEELASKE